MSAAAAAAVLVVVAVTLTTSSSHAASFLTTALPPHRSGTTALHQELPFFAAPAFSASSSSTQTSTTSPPPQSATVTLRLPLGTLFDGRDYIFVTESNVRGYEWTEKETDILLDDFMVRGLGWGGTAVMCVHACWNYSHDCNFSKYIFAFLGCCAWHIRRSRHCFFCW